MAIYMAPTGAGYDSGEVRDLAKEFGYTAHIRSRGEEAQALKHEAGFRARRWVVERTHSWMNRFRRILTRWEQNLKIICLCFILSVP